MQTIFFSYFILFLIKISVVMFCTPFIYQPPFFLSFPVLVLSPPSLFSFSLSHSCSVHLLSPSSLLSYSHPSFTSCTSSPPHSLLFTPHYYLSRPLTFPLFLSHFFLFSSASLPPQHHTHLPHTDFLTPHTLIFHTIHGTHKKEKWYLDQFYLPLKVIILL